MRKWGLDAPLVDDAALVVTELAANAVVHAASAFTVLVRAEDEGLDLAVEDSEPLDRVKPDCAPGARFGLVEGVSRRWGIDVSGDGKVIWAESEESSVREKSATSRHTSSSWDPGSIPRSINSQAKSVSGVASVCSVVIIR